VKELVRLLKLPPNAPPQQVFALFKERELILAFHPDHASKHEDELKSAQKLLHRSGDPTVLANEVFHRIREAAKKVKAMGGNTNTGPTADIPPPPLTGFEVDVVPTVGDFGIDLVIFFKFNPADVPRIPEVRFDLTLHNNSCEALGADKKCPCRKHKFTTTFLQNDFGEYVIQNQQLVSGLGFPIGKRVLEVSAGTANGNLKSSPLLVFIDITNKKSRKLAGASQQKRSRPG
jgi:hypothetical protein